MSQINVPLSLKPIKPYLTHAAQLEQHEPLMSYYCRCYAVQLGVELRNQNPSDDQKIVLMQLLDKLEADKKALGSQIAETNGKEYVEQFARQIFAKADNNDRSGNSTKAIARSFYAATIFFATLKQFKDYDNNNENGEEIEEKVKYAKWRAAEIMTAAKEGRSPLPPPSNEAENENGNDLLGDIERVDAGFGSNNSMQNNANDFPSINNNNAPLPTTNAMSMNNNDFQNFNSSPMPSNTNNNNNNASFQNDFLVLPSPPSSSPSLEQQHMNDQDGKTDESLLKSVIKSPEDMPSIDDIMREKEQRELKEIRRRLEIQQNDLEQQRLRLEEQRRIQQQQMQQLLREREQQQQMINQSRSSQFQQQQQSDNFSWVPTYDNLGISPESLDEAQKHARYAVSALQFEDVATAIKELQNSLAILKPM